MTPADREHYKSAGFVILRQAMDPADLDALEGAFEHYAEAFGLRHDVRGSRFARELSSLVLNEEAKLYELMRASPNLEAFTELPELIEPIQDLLGRTFSAKALRFRMDQPRDLRYLATWHQDHAYVGGSVDTVTAWVPLQDVDWAMGPLLVEPASHHYGPIPHTRMVGNRKCPGSRPGSDLRWDTRMIEMRRGDVLLFHSLLLHSGQPNLTDRVRYSVQVRYEPL